MQADRREFLRLAAAGFSAELLALKAPRRLFFTKRIRAVAFDAFAIFDPIPIHGSWDESETNTRAYWMNQALERWKKRAQGLKKETYALYLAAKDPRVPWYAKLTAVCVVGYAFSPIDLIPDFIPVLGYLDDLVVVPLGVALVLKMIPAEVMAECRAKASEVIKEGKPVNRIAAVVIISVWLLLSALTILLVLRITTN